MVKRLHIIGLALLAAMLVACGQRKNTSSAGEAVKSVPFPEVKIPNMITEPSERMTYVLDHFWDGMMSASLAGKCDSLHVKGILKDDVEQKFGLYTTILWSAPLDEARKSVSRLFLPPRLARSAILLPMSSRRLPSSRKNISMTLIPRFAMKSSIFLM